MLLEQEKIQEIEQKIGYEFDNKYLLTQAFIRTSYVNESKERVKSNEVLEFYGDRALEFVVTKLMAEKFGDVNGIFLDGKPYGDFFGEYNSEYSESKLSQIKASLVEKKALASAIDELDLQKYLYLGKGDIEREIEEEKSVKEDLFEAILGAVALDCNWNTEVLTKVVLAMHITEGRIDNIFINAQAFEENYPTTEYNVSIQDTTRLISNKLFWKGFERDVEINEWWNFQKRVVLTIRDKKSKILACYLGYGETRQEAVSNAKKNALNDKRGAKEINPILVATDNVSLENAINIMQELIQKGLLEKAEYRYNQTHVDEQGNPRWQVELVIPKIGKCMAVGYTSKKDAKKAVAYRSICEIRDMIKGKIELFPDIYDVYVRTKKYGILKPISIRKDRTFIMSSSDHLFDILIGLLENGEVIKLIFNKRYLEMTGFEILGENKDRLNDELIKYLSLSLKSVEEKRDILDKGDDISSYHFCKQLVGITVWDKEYGKGRIVGYDIINEEPWSLGLGHERINFKVEFNKKTLPRFINYRCTLMGIYERMAIEKADQRGLFFDTMIKIYEIKPFFIKTYNKYALDINVEEIINVSDEAGDYDFDNCEFPGPMSDYETIAVEKYMASIKGDWKC